MLRTSSYTIFVKLPDTDEDVLLVHGYTGAYDRVSRGVADFLRSRHAKRAAKPLYGEWSPEPEAAGTETVSDATIDLLRDQGHLTELSLDEEETFFSRLAEKLHERALRQAPSYIFMPTYDCNLRCSYCYQDHMRTDCSFKHLLRSMRRPIVDRIFAALPRIEELHGLDPRKLRRRNLGLFGGEPLLAANRPIIEYILGKAFETGEADFWAITNGTEIDAYRDLLGPAGIARLQITVDGPPREHDKRRVYADGSGSYERIAANITMALELGVAVSVRLNVDRHNLADLPAVADEIVARGWDRCPGFGAYTSPVRAGNGKTGAGSTLSSWDLDRALTRMREEHPHLRVLARPDEGLRAKARRIFDDSQEILPSLRPSFCSAHDRMYIFDPFGDIYTCWERTGDPNVSIGKVTPEGDVEFRFDQMKVWRSRTVASNPVCRRCRFALHCGGGCAILALDRNGAFNSNYCDGFAARFKASVAEAYLEHISGAGPAMVQERVCDQ
ncbi:MAG TPA: radical SAM protein [Thermoanaerobaculia bacterium]|nr:radical SAM protein [Thermoanaerobaculia bacterium]